MQCYPGWMPISEFPSCNRKTSEEYKGFLKHLELLISKSWSIIKYLLFLNKIFLSEFKSHLNLFSGKSLTCNIFQQFPGYLRQDVELTSQTSLLPGAQERSRWGWRHRCHTEMVHYDLGGYNPGKWTAANYKDMEVEKSRWFFDFSCSISCDCQVPCLIFQGCILLVKKDTAEPVPKKNKVPLEVGKSKRLHWTRGEWRKVGLRKIFED